MTNSYTEHPISGPWQVCAIPLETDHSQPSVNGDDAITVCECAHLQPILYPENPYWGDQLRAINTQAWLYRKTFTVPDRPFGRARLHFEGVDYFATVWLNGQVIGTHEGHFAPFVFDVTSAIQPGQENTLLVKVSSPWDVPNPRGSYPTDHVIRGLVKGLYEHGEGVIPPNVNPLGIWRPVTLLLDDGVSLDRVRIQTAIDGTIDLRIVASNGTASTWTGDLHIAVNAENHDGAGTTATIAASIPPGTHTIGHQLEIPEPRLWWPWDHGAPNLYGLTLSLNDSDGSTVSALTEPFGIREVVLERSPERFTYRINGRDVALRGSSYMPGLYLSQVNGDSLARDITLAREANLNLLRVHVHVSPPEVYDLCDEIGILIWQDFELNWIHDPSPEFETRARALQHAMIDQLYNHPSIITWTCYNEPTMVFTRRQNLEQRPAPQLYADALQDDPTRPVYLCSGQMESDWQRAGDIHTYYGALWTKRYTDVYRHRFLVNTEFGFEAPAALATLQQYPAVWERLDHLDDDQIATLWAYQAELIQFHVEHIRRLRATGCAGYVHFWLVDLVPQVGCGVLDAMRQPKGGYAALKRASQPLHVAMEHNGRKPIAFWVFNDTITAYAGATLTWKMYDDGDTVLHQEQQRFNVAANQSQKVSDINCTIPPEHCARLVLTLHDADGHLLTENHYIRPFHPMPRPQGYPWKFDRTLGTKVFDRPGAPSLADASDNPLFKLVPLRVKEEIAEWALRQKLPTWLVSRMARVVDKLNS